MPTAKVQWVEGMQFVGTDSGGHSVVLSGDDRQNGVRPSEMLLVALFSFLLGAYLTHGLQKLTAAANAISNGVLGTQVDINGSDELAVTADSFNTMSRRLAESQQQIQQSIDTTKKLSAEIEEQKSRLSTIL